MRKISQPSSKNAFTLMEILVVIIVIGILATIAIPAYRDYLVRSVVSQALRVMEPMRAAVLEYYNMNGSAPPDNTIMHSPVTFTQGPFKTLRQRGMIIDILFSSETPEIDGKYILLDAVIKTDSIKYYCRTSAVAALVLDSKYVPTGCLTWAEFSAL